MSKIQSMNTTTSSEYDPTVKLGTDMRLSQRTAFYAMRDELGLTTKDILFRGAEALLAEKTRSAGDERVT